MRAERLLHAGHERERGAIREPADLDHRLRQLDAALQVVHDRAAAGFHVQHDRACAGGDFLGHDRGDDQRQAVDRAGHVAQRVERLIGRGEVGGLSDDGHTDFAHLPDKPVHRDIDARAGDALDLVERSAGVAQAAAAHLGDFCAAGGAQGRDDQRRRIAHAAGRMLVHAHAADAGKIGHFAGMHHGEREVARFFGGHAVKPGGHQQRGQLVIGNGSLRRALREINQLFMAERLPVLFLFDQIDHVHMLLSSPSAASRTARQAVSFCSKGIV